MLVSTNLLVLILNLALSIQISLCDNENILQINDGMMRGKPMVTKKNTNYVAYQGIPYAAPPIDNLRFKPPAKPEKWKGIMDATTEKAMCHQFKQTPGTENFNLPQKEDCLYLSVYVPQISKSQSLSVMVYFYGGGYYEGHYSSSLYGPEFFMDKEVIIVTLNYRLGVFGFLSTEDLIIPGNAGLKDQLLALKWVNQNVRYFGGDPNQVTIFGHSVGGVSVSLMTLNPKSKGLYRAAISQSGTALVDAIARKGARKIAHQIASYINLSFNSTSEKSSQELLDLLLNTDAEKLNKIAELVSNESTKSIAFFPVIEPNHEDAFLTSNIYELFSTGSFNHIPQIMGITSEEWLFQSQNPEFIETLEYLDMDVTNLVPDNMNINDVENKTMVGKFVKHLYSNGESFANNLGSGLKYISDTVFTKAIIKTANLMCRYTDIYFYEFSYDGPLGQINFTVPGADKVGHAEEIFYLWANDNIEQSIYPENDLNIREILLTLWTNFAKTLNPLIGDPIKFVENLQWPLVNFHGNDSFVYLDIGKNLMTKNFPKEDTFRIWDFLYSYYGVPPFNTF